MSAAQRTKPKPWVQGSGQAQQDCCGIKPVATEDPAISPGLSKGEPEASVQPQLCHSLLDTGQGTTKFSS